MKHTLPLADVGHDVRLTVATPRPWCSWSVDADLEFRCTWDGITTDPALAAMFARWARGDCTPQSFRLTRADWPGPSDPFRAVVTFHLAACGDCFLVRLSAA